MPQFEILLRKTLVHEEVKIIEAKNLSDAIDKALVGDGRTKSERPLPGKTEAIDGKMVG